MAEGKIVSDRYYPCHWRWKVHHGYLQSPIRRHGFKAIHKSQFCIRLYDHFTFVCWAQLISKPIVVCNLWYCLDFLRFFFQFCESRQFFTTRHYIDRVVVWLIFQSASIEPTIDDVHTNLNGKSSARSTHKNNKRQRNQTSIAHYTIRIMHIIHVAIVNAINERQERRNQIYNPSQKIWRQRKKRPYVTHIYKPNESKCDSD